MVDHLSEEALAAYGEPAEADPVTDPVVEEGAPAVEATEDPATPTQEGAPAATAPVVEDPWAQYGGQERVNDAVAIAEALSTKEGIEALVREGLVALDLDPDTAFGIQKEEVDPDALMTRAEFEQERAKDRETFAQAQRSRRRPISRPA